MQNYALVTGASRGLGKAFARALAGQQRNLILVARSKEKLETLARELRTAQQILVEPIEFDLAQPRAGKRLVEELSRRELHVDLLINNAGFGLQGQLWKLDLDRQIEMINLHTAAVVELTHLLLPPMIEEQRGAIVNISSMAGFQSLPYATLYSATKSFLTTFSLALECEVRRYKLPVVTVCPGRLKPEIEDPDRQKFPGGEQSHEEIVTATLKLLERGGGLLVPGWVNKVALLAERLLPRRLVAKGAGKMSRPK
jgi:short-subunit dehydrogenase